MRKTVTGTAQVFPLSLPKALVLSPREMEPLCPSNPGTHIVALHYSSAALGLGSTEHSHRGSSIQMASK